MAECNNRKATCKDCLHVHVCIFRNAGEDEEICRQFINKADVAEVRRGELRCEINSACFEDVELAKERGWYRKFFYCPNCDQLIRTESWDDHRMFGSGTVLKTNKMPNYCPYCGAKMDGGNDDG